MFVRIIYHVSIASLSLSFLTPSFLLLRCIGDHLEEVAEMIVTKFGVSGDAVFLDLDGEFVSYA